MATESNPHKSPGRDAAPPSSDDQTSRRGARSHTFMDLWSRGVHGASKSSTRAATYERSTSNVALRIARIMLRLTVRYLRVLTSRGGPCSCVMIGCRR
jgi:hypothetical protein